MAVVRPATVDDVPEIVSIHNSLLRTTTYEWTEADHTAAEWQRRLEDKARRAEPVLVLDDVGHIVGWATYGAFRDTDRWPGYGRTVEHTIHLALNARGQGLGRILLERLMQDARQAGKRVMVAGIDSSNGPSVRFHERCGFVEVARMPGVGEKWGQSLDLILMQRRIDGS